MAYPPIAVPTDSDDAAFEEASAWDNQRASQIARRAAIARKSSGRRRLVDPATCERDYSRAEVEFMQAMQAYKTTSGSTYPTWGEVLQVVHDLGYQKLEPSGPPAESATEPAPAD